MIQRIQTLYLLAIVALMAATIFTPMAYFVGGVHEYMLYAFALRGVESDFSTMYMGIGVKIVAAISATMASR